MQAFRALLVVNFKSLLLNTMGSSRRRNRTKSSSGLGALVIIAAIMIWISGTWSFTLATTLGPEGGLDIMLSFMTIFALFFPLFFTLYAAQGTLFSTKDIDLVLSLPVPTVYVMLARLMALYLEIVLMLECILIPAGVAWLMNGGSGGVGFLVLLIVQGLFLALIPALITLIFGYLISLLISRLQRKNLFNTIFSILLVLVLLVVIFAMNSGMDMIATDIEGVRQTLYSSFPPIQWVVESVTGPNLLYLLGIVVACVVPFGLVSWLFSLNYKTLLTRLSSHTLKSNYKIGTLGVSGSFAALCKKEARRYFGSPTYFLNSGIIIIMVVIASVVVVFLRGTIAEFLGAVSASAGAGNDLFARLLPVIYLAVMVFFLLTIMPSSVSVSLEGKTLWILKEAPVGTGRIFLAKGGFTALLGIITTVISVPLVSFGLGFHFTDALGIFLVCVLYTIHVGMLGLYVNLRFPRLDYENETVVIKQSASMLLSMLFSLLTAGILVAVYFLLNSLGASFFVFCLAAVVVLLVIDLLLYQRLNTKGRRLWNEL